MTQSVESDEEKKRLGATVVWSTDGNGQQAREGRNGRAKIEAR